MPIESDALRMEAEKMLEIAKRMAKSLIEYFQADQFTPSCFNSVLSATQLTKSLNTRTWYLRPFDHALDLSEIDVNKLKRRGIDSVEKLLAANPREIEDVRWFILLQLITQANSFEFVLLKLFALLSADFAEGHTIRQ